MSDRLVQFIKRHEGWRGHAYDDATGRRVHAPVGKLTIGYGRNIDARPLTKVESEYLLSRDLAEVEAKVEDAWEDVDRLDEVRYAACVSMAYQLGIAGFLSFRRMRTALERADYEEAYRHAIDSRWAREQTPDRARETAQMLRDGIWPEWMG